jgi:hypothetical protein
LNTESEPTWCRAKRCNEFCRALGRGEAVQGPPDAWLGISKGRATVTVDGYDNGLYRRGECFRTEVPVASDSLAVWQNVAVTLNLRQEHSAEARNLSVPKTPELFSYDADGDLLTDGRWN